ncbi:MAG: fumarate hydratase [Brevinematales bacterium]|nr:fumarate hydratase [Brevinematales bacterium]
MKEIFKEVFNQKFYTALNEAHFFLREDIKSYLIKLSKNLANKEKDIVSIYIENFKLAEDEKRAICQDTGYVQVFVELGRDVHIGFNIKETIEEIVKDFYEKNFLRKSLTNPITKKNTETNTPVFIDYEIVEGEVFKVDILIKGGGSENATRTKLLLPTLTKDQLEEVIIEEIKSIGAKACPPYIIGVCIGGNLEKAIFYSKKLLLYKIDENPMDSLEMEISNRLKKKINELPIGFQGLKFGETVIDLKLKILPSHIATLPLAISVGCNVVRQSSFTI